MNEIHIPKEFDYKPGAEDFPLMCVLSFVYICNAGCPNCPYNNSDIRATYKNALIMPEDIFKRIADECAEHQCYLRLSGGGEPMLHPQATPLMAYAKNKGCKIGLITNGSNFTEKDLRILINSQVDLIEFSVDAPDEETYSKVRPGLRWGKLNSAVEKAIRIRNELKNNTKIIASIVNQKGVDIEKAKKHWEDRVDKVQIRKYLTWGYNEDLSQDPSPYLPPEDRIPCPWLFERFNIDSRGDVTVCGEDIAFKEKFGNMMQNSIKELWKHPKMEYFREQHLNRQGDKISICGKCPDWQYRSWNYNYWKIVNDAEKKRKSKISQE